MTILIMQPLRFGLELVIRSKFAADALRVGISVMRLMVWVMHAGSLFPKERGNFPVASSLRVNMGPKRSLLT